MESFTLGVGKLLSIDNLSATITGYVTSLNNLAIQNGNGLLTDGIRSFTGDGTIACSNNG